MKKIFTLYELLYETYGAQGWWPLLRSGGYHKKNYTLPNSNDEVFEVCLGAILTQNTNFNSVVRSLENLHELNALSARGIKKLPLELLKNAIKPSGYFNQKSRYILAFVRFFEKLNTIPTREELLEVVGIGEETADSILLYAYKQEEFVVDAYTKRIFLHLGIIDEKAGYKDVKSLVESSLQEFVKEEGELLRVYQEFHALLVEHAKRFYSKKPHGYGCPLVNKL